MKHAFTALALAVFVVGGHAQEAAAAAPAPVPAATSDLRLCALVSWDGKNVFRGIERSDRDGLVQSLVTLADSAPGLSGLSAYARSRPPRAHLHRRCPS